MKRMIGNVNVPGVTPSELNEVKESVSDLAHTIAMAPIQSGSLAYTGSAQSPTWNGYDTNKLTLSGTTTGTNAGAYTATFTPKTGYQWSDGTSTAKTVTWRIDKAMYTLALSAATVTSTANSMRSITVTRSGDGKISASSNNTRVAEVSVVGSTINIVTKRIGTATITVGVEASANYDVPYEVTCVVTVAGSAIYGAEWDGTSTTAWTRTDDASLFTDPVPYVKGATSYSSPFDDIQPWAGMERVSDSEAGELVKIPKFWYSLTQSGTSLKIQISDRYQDGFCVSPAHMDRGDVNGERDVVYIGRYHCAADTYKSTTGVMPAASITRSTARTNIHNLGSDIWQSDFAMRFTIWLLYIVEFADWNSQAKIGYGCGNNRSPENMGASDAMPYHTGTMQTSRTTYGVGVQYRYIEGLLDNVYDWCDGCYNNSNGFNIVLNPASFSDTTGGTSVGTPSSGYPSAFTISTDGGYPLFIPSASSGSTSTYSCDHWYFGSSFPCVYVGGCWLQHTNFGLFFVNCSSISNANTNIGCRLQKLPVRGV